MPRAEGGGIYRYALADNGTLRLKARLVCDMPMYAVSSRGRLHILLRAPFADSDASGIFTSGYDFKNILEIKSTKGKAACHLAVDGKDTYIVNYSSGNIVKNGVLEKTLAGTGINEVRQEMPHTHCVGFSPDKKFVLVTDLGTDTLYSFDRGLRIASSAKVPGGFGIRHFVFSVCGKYIYAINELVPSLSVFSYHDGELSYLTTERLPCEKYGANGAAIRLSADGKFLYCSVRGENAVYVSGVDNERHFFIQKASCGGESPRDFIVCADNKKLICANEKSGGVTVFSIKDGKLNGVASEIKLKKPLCVIETE
jgi:6-phosphogluconolactonase